MSRNVFTKDITGNQYGNLVALYPTKDRSYNSVIWVFQCKCGSIVRRSLRSVSCSMIRGRKIGCGCHKLSNTIEKYKYLIGMEFGKLTINSLDIVKGKVMCTCSCACGRIKHIQPRQISTGRHTSCSHSCRIHNPMLPEGMSNAKQIYLLYRNYARLHGLHFDLTFDQFLEVSQSPCHECGTRPMIAWNSPVEHGRNGAYIHNKIAYVDISLGYTYSNVVPMCIDHIAQVRVYHRHETQST